MKKLMKKKPVLTAFLFPILMMLFCAFLVSLMAGTIGNEEICYSISRILTALLLYGVFAGRGNPRKNRHWGRDLRLLWPMTLVILFNLVFDSMKGAETAALGTALLFSLAPGLYEEILYRRIILTQLYEHFRGKEGAVRRALILSAISFAWIHLTNLSVLGLEATVLQIAYAFVFGLFFGAYYLKTENLLFLIAAHWAVDFSSEILITEHTAWTAVELMFLAVLLLLMFVVSMGLQKGLEAEAAGRAEREEN